MNEYKRLLDKAKGQKHPYLPAKRIDGRTFCIHGYSWAEGEVKPCKECLKRAEYYYGNESNLTLTEKRIYKQEWKPTS